MRENIKMNEQGRIEVEVVNTYDYDPVLFKTDLEAEIVKMQTQIDYWTAEKLKAENRLNIINGLLS